MKPRNIAWGLWVAAAACSAPRDAPPPGTKQVGWSAASGSLRPAADSGFVVDVEVRAAIVDGWHIYSVGQKEGGPVPLSVKVSPSPPYSVAGNVTGPQPEIAKDPNFGIETETYSSNAIIKVPVRVSASGGADLPPLELKVRSQACSDRVCLPAQTTTLVVNPKPPNS
ncbi:MAG: protein-disulfide reductase DsbD domain-containing protein [Acidobacteriota bacterium]